MTASELLEERAPMFGLRKIVHPDGSYGYLEGHAPVDSRESLYPSDIATIKRALGFGAMLILDLDRVDYTRGAYQISQSTKVVWLLDGRRITISYENRIAIASVSNETDPEMPAPAFMDRRPKANPTARIRKCIHPECEVMVDLAKKPSGACKRAHMNFECTHPKCIERAAANNWPRATHSHGTKIGADHWQYRHLHLPQVQVKGE